MNLCCSCARCVADHPLALLQAAAAAAAAAGAGAGAEVAAAAAAEEEVDVVAAAAAAVAGPARQWAASQAWEAAVDSRTACGKCTSNRAAG